MVRIEIHVEEFEGIKIEGGKLVTDSEEAATAVESLDRMARKLREWAAAGGRRVKTHFLKTRPPFFQAILNGSKTFEVRLDDGRNFQVGDVLALEEWDDWDKVRTGRVVHRQISFILAAAQFPAYLQPGVVVMGLWRPRSVPPVEAVPDRVAPK